MKSYTDLEQSKILEKILPIKSADMRFCFSHTLGGRITGHYPMIGREPSMGTIPCWSLAALLNVLPHIQEFYPTIERINDKYVCRYKNSGIWTNGADLIDACYEMVLKLHEQNIL